MSSESRDRTPGRRDEGTLASRLTAALSPLLGIGRRARVTISRIVNPDYDAIADLVDETSHILGTDIGVEHVAEEAHTAAPAEPAVSVPEPVMPTEVPVEVVRPAHDEEDIEVLGPGGGSFMDEFSAPVAPARVDATPTSGAAVVSEVAAAPFAGFSLGTDVIKETTCMVLHDEVADTMAIAVPGIAAAGMEFEDVSSEDSALESELAAAEPDDAVEFFPDLKAVDAADVPAEGPAESDAAVPDVPAADGSEVPFMTVSEEVPAVEAPVEAEAIGPAPELTAVAASDEVPAIAEAEPVAVIDAPAEVGCVEAPVRESIASAPEAPVLEMPAPAEHLEAPSEVPAISAASAPEAIAAAEAPEMIPCAEERIAIEAPAEDVLLAEPIGQESLVQAESVAEVCAPEPVIAVEAAEPVEAIAPAEAVEAIRSPEEVLFVEAPEVQESIAAPEAVIAVESAEAVEAITSPEEVPAVESAEAQESIPAPEEAMAVEAPEAIEAIQSPEQIPVIEAAEAQESIAAPEPVIAVEAPASVEASEPMAEPVAVPEAVPVSAEALSEDVIVLGPVSSDAEVCEPSAACVAEAVAEPPVEIAIGTEADSMPVPEPAAVMEAEPDVADVSEEDVGPLAGHVGISFGFFGLPRSPMSRASTLTFSFGRP